MKWNVSDLITKSLKVFLDQIKRIKISVEKIINRIKHNDTNINILY